MNKTNSVMTWLKGILLILIDTVTILVMFSFWPIVNISLFPWALIAILISLVLVNGLVLLSSNVIKWLGLPTLASMAILTGLLYIVTLIYTRVVYAFASPREYVITILIFALIYIGSMIGLYMSGLAHFADLARMASEKEKVASLNLLLTEIKNVMGRINLYFENEEYNKVVNTFDAVRERVQASTPFGRIIDPAVIEMEERLNAKLQGLQEEIEGLSSDSDLQKALDSMMRDLSEITILIRNREKLIIQ
jgi:hypothetical protein